MKILFVSLGCDKNLVDSEEMLGFLSRAGYEFTDDETQAEVIVVNTCCFIGDAKEESINTLLEMAAQKEDGQCKVLIAAGCLAQRYQEEVLAEIPEVDGILGTASCDKIVSVVEAALAGKRETKFEDLNHQKERYGGRVVTTGGHYAYLKIAEGCDKHCTYCVIPGVRGAYRSVPMEALLEEAKELSDGGVRELILVAQETTLYGVDLYGEKKLPELLRKLAEIPGIHWIRLLYCYPEEITDQLIETIKTEKKICHYMDIPIQHASDRILKRMGRRTSRAEITARIGRLREEIPDMAVRTTMITGFPGETREDVEELLDFVDEMEFERLGVFPYSQEEGTPAAAMEGQVPEEIKTKRRDQVMELQQEISLAAGEAMVGQELEVFIEGRVADENAYVGRTYMDAPGVDGYIFVNTSLDLMSGMFVRVKVTGALEYDLIGELCDEQNESAE
ncbi:MAG: 30S ribosomal protein S12 methylthiotransferase RimO [Lachnospiraceae bacterium]|nr:30S ribosomal protein S12 methylthiotransferase RimO [Lachnospiraceae bacterium]